MVNWDKIKQDKEIGGLGIRVLKEMNEALSLKWWWRFGTEKEALWRRLLNSKYHIDFGIG